MWNRLSASDLSKAVIHWNNCESQIHIPWMTSEDAASGGLASHLVFCSSQQLRFERWWPLTLVAATSHPSVPSFSFQNSTYFLRTKFKSHKCNRLPSRSAKYSLDGPDSSALFYFAYLEKHMRSILRSPLPFPPSFALPLYVRQDLPQSRCSSNA